MPMAQLTAYGKEVKKRLIDIGQPQEWLIGQIKEKTGLFCDAGYLYKIFTGDRNAPTIVTAINEILGIKERD